MFDFISTNMPDDNPGSLVAGKYLELIAFIAEVNGLAPGPDPLPDDPDMLATMGFFQ